MPRYTPKPYDQLATEAKALALSGATRFSTLSEAAWASIKYQHASGPAAFIHRTGMRYCWRFGERWSALYPTRREAIDEAALLILAESGLRQKAAAAREILIPPHRPAAGAKPGRRSLVRDIARALIDAAGEPDGAVTRDDLTRAGFSDREIDRHLPDARRLARRAIHMAERNHVARAPLLARRGAANVIG